MWYLAAFILGVWLIGFWPTVILIALLLIWAFKDDIAWLDKLSEKLDPMRQKLGLKTHAQRMREQREMTAMGARMVSFMNETGQTHKLREFLEKENEQEQARKESNATLGKRAAAFGVGAVAGYKAVQGAGEAGGLTAAEKSEISIKERDLRGRINSAQSTINFCTFNLK